METMEGSPSSLSSRASGDVEPCPPNNNNDTKEDDIDIEELLARPRHRRGYFRRQKASINKAWSLLNAPEFVKRLSAFEEAKAGSTVVFSCQWQALPRPTVKWYKDDEEMIEDNNNRVQFIESETGELKLVINNCRKKDEAAYKCKAENAEGVASTTGYLSVSGDVTDKPLSAQPRKNAQHAVSNAPRLRAIVEQKSLELREEEECSSLPPSPIHDYVETFQKKHKISAKHKSPPLPLDDLRTGDEYDSGSDTSVESQDFDRVRMTEFDSEVFDRELTPESEVTASRSEFLQQEQDGGQILNPETLYPGNGELNNPTGGSGNPEVVRERVVPATRKTKKREQNGHPQTAIVDVKYVSHFAYAKIQSPVLHGPVTEPLQEQMIRSASVNATTTAKPAPATATVKILDPATARTTATASAKSTAPAKTTAQVNTTAPANTTAQAKTTAVAKTTATAHTVATATTQTTLEFPWLFALAFSSVGTLVATATDMSPVLFVLLLAVISLLSFRILITTKTQPT